VRVSGALLTTASTLMCPHGGMVSAIPSSGRVTVAGAAAVLATDTFTIAGCAFAPVIPHPCVLVQWQLPAQRSTSGGLATLTEDSVGFCVAADGAIQGPVLIQATQQQSSSL
jgi:hypothetical protein